VSSELALFAVVVVSLLTITLIVLVVLHRHDRS
jgi:hypothetical protein